MARITKIKTREYDDEPEVPRTGGTKAGNVESLTGNDDDEDEPKKRSNEDLARIGRTGEEYAFRCLTDEVKKANPGCKYEEDKGRLVVRKSRRVVAEAVWLNCAGEVRDECDMKLTEKGITTYIEVKSTTDETKEWVPLSAREWRTMKRLREFYHILRVFCAGSESPRIERICDPARLWFEDKIDARPIQIRI